MMTVCPRDGASLVEVNKSGVQIDVCPECKGVWLDRGELEKIMQITRELEQEFAGPPRPQMPQPIQAQPDPRFEPRSDPRLEPRPDARLEPRPDPRFEARPEYRDDRGYDSRGYRRDDDDDDDYRKRKRKSGLSKLFDIFD
jgi:uncharacterized protein